MSWGIRLDKSYGHVFTWWHNTPHDVNDRIPIAIYAPHNYDKTVTYTYYPRDTFSAGFTHKRLSVVLKKALVDSLKQ